MANLAKFAKSDSWSGDAPMAARPRPSQPASRPPNTPWVMLLRQASPASM